MKIKCWLDTPSTLLHFLISYSFIISRAFFYSLNNAGDSSITISFKRLNLIKKLLKNFSYTNLMSKYNWICNVNFTKRQFLIATLFIFIIVYSFAWRLKNLTHLLFAKRELVAFLITACIRKISPLFYFWIFMCIFFIAAFIERERESKKEKLIHWIFCIV